MLDDLDIGDHVYIEDEHPSNKLVPKFSEKWRIVNTSKRGNSFCIKSPNGRIKWRNGKNLRKWTRHPILTELLEDSKITIPEATKLPISDHNNRSTKTKYNLREL